MRTEFSAKTKVAAFERARGRCENCSVKLAPGNTEYDHDETDWMGGEATLANCKVRCKTCHRLKTTRDIKKIARSRKRYRTNINAKATKSRPMPGTRASGIRKRMSGLVEKW